MNLRTAVIVLVAIAALGVIVTGHFDGDTDRADRSPCADGPRPAVDLRNGSLDRVEVWLATPNGTVLARVRAQIAASPESRRIGLRETDTPRCR